MLYSICINALTTSISANEKILDFLYIQRRHPRTPIGSVGIQNVDSAGQAGFTYQGSCVNSYQKFMCFRQIRFSLLCLLLFLMEFLISRSGLCLMYCISALFIAYINPRGGAFSLDWK